jgi:hypothetical protein
MTIQWRLAVCREPGADGSACSFYLINDSPHPVDAVLYQVGYEWGDMGNYRDVDVHVAGLAPGASARVWRDDDSAEELRADLRVAFRTPSGEVRVMFEFPKLYRKTDLPVVPGLARPGWVAAATLL